MSSSSNTPSAPDVTALAVRLNLLSPADAESLRLSSEQDGVPPLQVALRTGLLSAETIDIVETLLRPHEAIPGYEMLDLLGRGGMGVVYRARQVALNRVVAIKTIRVGRMADGDSVARFEQEARTIAQLRHPNIVGAFDFGRHAGRLFLAMEFVDGTDAETLVERQGPLPERTVWALMRQAAAGLAHAWSRRIVHRDIKPANLLLIEKPEGFPLPPGIPLVMIADFGLAQLSEMVETKTRLTAENVTVGSPHYMAPEQLQSSDVDFRADVYSLGATALHLLTGSPPLLQLNLSQLITRKLTSESIADEPEYRSRLTPRTHALLRRMTARQPQDRLDSYAALIDELDLLLAETVESGPNTLAWRSQPTLLFATNSATPPSSGTATDNIAQAITRDHLAESSGPITSVLSSPTSSSAHRDWKVRLGGKPGLIAIVSMLILAGTFGFWMISHGKSRRSGGMAAGPQGPLVVVPMKEAGFSQHLFNGTNLSNFKPLTGNWIVPQENAVIAGSDGSIAAFLVRRGPGNQPVPLTHYRLELLVELHTAQAAWIEFAVDAFDPAKRTGGSSWAVRLQGNQAELVQRVNPESPWQPSFTPVPADPKKQHAVTIERNPSGWFLSLDDRPLGSVPLSDPPESPEFRLGAEGGPAWFSDLLVTEMQTLP